ncbi:hypothetical protein JCM18899A_05700 [Nocardioides sp. AN3]
MPTRPARPLWRRTVAIGAAAVTAAWLPATLHVPAAVADSPVLAASVTPVPSAGETSVRVRDSSTRVMTLSGGLGDDLRLDSVGVPAGRLRPLAGRLEARLRRVPDGCTAVDRQTVWAGPYGVREDGYDVAGTLPTTMEQALEDPSVGNGVDNALTNDPSATCNDVERIDLLGAPHQVVDPAADGYLLLERGGNDPFGIAAVTAVDAGGDPLAVGPLHAARAGGWGSIRSLSLTALVMRKDPSEAAWTLTSRLSEQPVAGRLVTAADLGLSAGQRMFGVVIVAADVAPHADLLRPDSFPRDTTEASGGLDLIGATPMTTRPEADPEPAAPTGLALAADVRSPRDLDHDGVDAGDEVTARFVVRNSGALALRDVSVVGDRLGRLTCPDSGLRPGASMTCTAAPLRLVQHDLDAGHLVVSAVARATLPDGPPPGTQVTAHVATDLRLPRRPSMSVERRAGSRPAGAARAVFRFVMWNTGNVTLTDVGVNMPFAREVTCPATTLAPGRSTTCSVAAS